MFHAQHLCCSSLGFLKEDFWSFYHTHIVKTMTPLGRGQFWPKGFYLNKLCRHFLEHVSCLICIKNIQYRTLTIYHVLINKLTLCMQVVIILYNVTLYLMYDIVYDMLFVYIISNRMLLCYVLM
jgi:hypothetical protein